MLIIAKPDNVPIVALIFLVMFFTWYSMREAVRNDLRVAAGDVVVEKEESDRVWVWPDLVYTELIALVLCSAILVVWSIALEAPIEQPANPANTPNPSKAPWYFLGLQEMLVYFDPWLAGVVLPSLIIVGLMAIPYIDTNPKGNGYYTFNERKVEITIFLFGFVVLWSALIVLGTFLRGPNWNFFGPFEYWDVHKLEALNNVQLSEYLWVRGAGTALPENILVREGLGILVAVAYVTIVPVILARTLLKRYYEKMGPTRFYVGVFLLLMMLSLPIKMFSRWLVNLKYVVSIPEWFFQHLKTHHGRQEERRTRLQRRFPERRLRGLQPVPVLHDDLDGLRRLRSRVEGLPAELRAARGVRHLAQPAGGPGRHRPGAAAAARRRPGAGPAAARREPGAGGRTRGPARRDRGRLLPGETRNTTS